MNAETPVASRSSADLKAEVDAIARDRADATAALAKGESDREAIILAGDDKQAEQHDADMARHRRAIERADLRLPTLRDAHAAAQRREEADDAAKRRAEVEAAIVAFERTFVAEYERPAAKIAAFCREWVQINERAIAAGVQSLDARFCAEVLRDGNETEYRDEPYECYIDAIGNETAEPYETGGDGIRRREPQFVRQKVTRTRRVMVRDRRLPEYAVYPSVADAVNLPNVSLGREAFRTATARQAYFTNVKPT